MYKREKILYEGHTAMAQYSVVEMVYENRQARVLLSANRMAAISGIPLDGNDEMLFDYVQRLFELVTAQRPKRLLMIGGGCLTLPTALIQNLPDIEIVVVEIDPGLEEIAVNYFDYEPDKRLRVFYQDGKDFLASNTEIYDMVIIDAFDSLEIPDSLNDYKTVKYVHGCLGESGIAAVNLIASFYGRASSILARHYQMYNSSFDKVFIYPVQQPASLWVPENYIILAQTEPIVKAHGMRYGALDPANITK
jgi:spermidine synthase